MSEIESDFYTERLKKQMDFALEIDKEKNIFRQTHLSGYGRNENDAEHAWHMAIMAYILKEYSNEDIDISKVMLMCLIHDIVEIDAGDTYAYDEEGKKTQKDRESMAKQRLFSMLPDDLKEEFIKIFDEFEESATPESKFAHAMDNLQPLMLNNSNGGRDWREHKVSAEQVYGRQGRTKEGSETLFKLTDHIIKENIKKGNISNN
ncbi:MAG: HD domain-containing protein [Lachnospiraceae bacterium]|nr:HD domain-containing protein [Lachnospiraceae bacterium]